MRRNQVSGRYTLTSHMLSIEASRPKHGGDGLLLELGPRFGSPGTEAIKSADYCEYRHDTCGCDIPSAQ